MAFPWLHYSIEKDAAFCHVYMRVEIEGKFISSHRRDKAFITRGYTYWKDATTASKKHQSSVSHKEATQAVVVLPTEVRDVGELLNEVQQQEKEKKNRQMLLRILRSLRFSARQSLALR